MNKRQLSRRHFTLCAAVGLSLPIVPAASVVAADAPPRTVKLRNTAIVPAVGQGSARLGQGRHPETAEQEALRTGISLGMSLIDTSGNYGNGRSEKLIGRAIAGQRDSVFLVSKVEADEVSGDRMTRACEASLSRLGTNFLDLYLLHWPVPNYLFSDVVAGFEQLRAAGKIKAWGVSNFNIDQMEALFRVPEGSRCATNQVPYSLNSRGIERDLFPWCTNHDLPLMAYSTLGGENRPLITDTARSRRSVRLTVARRPRSRWPGLSAVATLSQFPKPALQHTSRRTPWRFHSRSPRKNFRHSTRPFRDHPGPTSLLRTIAAVLVPLAMPCSALLDAMRLSSTAPRSPQLLLVVDCAFHPRSSTLGLARVASGQFPSRVMHGVPDFFFIDITDIPASLGLTPVAHPRISGVEPPPIGASGFSLCWQERGRTIPLGEVTSGPKLRLKRRYA